MMRRLFSVAAAILLAASTSRADDSNTSSTTTMKSAYFLELLHPVRDNLMSTMSKDEEAAIGRHFEYLKGLRDSGTVLMAGPQLSQPPMGIALLKAADLEAARQIQAADPAIQAGVFKGEVHPFSLALWRDTAPATPADPSVKALRQEMEVPASLDEVWELWTTREGLRKFIVQDAKVELRTGGPYEWYFNMKAPEGERGSEGCHILSFLPKKMFSFEWNAPPTFPNVRKGPHSFVVVEFEQLAPRRTRVRLTHLGWGEGKEWDDVYNYFGAAWPQVMGALKEHFEPAGKPS